MSWIMDKDQHESRLNHLLQTGAFRDAKLPLGQSRRQFAHRALKRWYKFNEGCDIITAERTWRQLKADMKGYDLPAPDPKALVSYHSIPSTPQTHLVLDPHGRILAYKFRVPLNLIATLASSSEQLPPKSVQCQRRGHFECSHFALWADSSPDLMMSSEYQKQLPHSEAFLQANDKLYRWLGHQLRLLSPELYCLYSRVDRHLGPSQHRLGGAWHGTVVNRQIGSSEDLRAHKEWKDWPKGLNAVVFWGDYTGGGLVAYNLGLF
ncbi:hypothetical protein VC83_00694 [Pseudogymnoascus destructans]|uniref:Uncharacterized protein n=2 Tax=Pseudogymnoascus destructans TaxID=655981 RepID=L8FW20_PSED2|nr:uncharacterized protein VC83_00694 [Pseudogymnoascus destructans]ELR04729.1 hypothetical protein GMDG_06958 [Pseudogymnoascus destructans 20631-21]OAF62449.1 hypothetical protein VC83_00694 [Pseudogymnoascus destructans]